MTPRLVRILLALAALWPTPGRTAPPVEVTEITWLQGYRATPEASATEARMAGGLLPFLARAMPQVRQPVVQANARRAWALIAQGDPVCQPSSVRTPEREKIAYFTDTLLGPPQQLIVRRELLKELPRSPFGEVDLQQLLADKHLRGALVDGRSYGSSIDAMLARQPPGRSLTRYAMGDFGSQLLPMLSLSRADYTIGYDAFLGQSQRDNPKLKVLVSQPIAGAGEPVRAGVACPRTPWGLAAIRAIDKAIGTPAGAALLKDESTHWLTPEARQHYSAQFESFFKERAKPSVIR